MVSAADSHEPTNEMNDIKLRLEKTSETRRLNSIHLKLKRENAMKFQEMNDEIKRCLIKMTFEKEITRFGGQGSEGQGTKIANDVDDKV